MNDQTPLPLLDRAVVDELIDGIGEEGARSVIELFVQEIATYLDVIMTAAGDPEDVAWRDKARRAAHSLKSGAGQVGAAAVSAAAAEVERIAAENAPGLSAAARRLQQCAGETAAAYRDWLAE